MSLSQVALSIATKVRAGPKLGLSRIPGVSRLHLLVHRVFARVEEWIMRRNPEIDAFGFVISIDPADGLLAPRLLRTGTWEPAETALFAEAVTPGMTVVDIGANIGLYTLIAARATGASGRVFAFEPGTRTAEFLRRNVARNGLTNVVIEEVAVARGSGNAALFITEERNPGLASLSPVNAPDGAKGVPVRTTCLDAYFANITIDVIKIDTQGAETDVVLGATRVLDRDRPVVFAELWPAGLRGMGSDGRIFLSVFARNGYTIASVDQPHTALSVDETLLLAERGDLDIVLWPQSPM